MTSTGTATVQIASAGLTAEIALRGAELVRLQDEAGRDLLWDGDPAVWTGRSPILFPIVGRLKDDRLTVDGVAYPMRQHGLARTSTFDLVEADHKSCRLRLSADASTKQSFPYAFRLDLTYRVTEATLAIEAAVHNIGQTAMPVSFGFHPAFRWPLPYGAAALDHAIVFAEDEPGPLATLVGGLVSDRQRPSPVHGRRLALEPHLFDEDALIFTAPASRSVRYGPPGGRTLRVEFAGMPQLGLWSKPGAPFVCIEPWHGYASPASFDGDITEKPGMTSLAPDETRGFSMQVSLDRA